MVQYLRPDSDVTSVTSGSFTAGLFRATTGTTGWETLDDVSPYGTGGRIYSDYGDDATYTCTLSNPNPSGTPASGTCTLTIRGGRGSGDATATSGGNNVVWNVDVSDDDFSTRITLTGNNGGIDEVYPNTEDTQSVRTWTFNTSAVSNWNNLKVRINVESQAVDANARNIRIDAIELAVPPTARFGVVSQALAALTGTLTGSAAATSQYLRPDSDITSVGTGVPITGAFSVNTGSTGWAALDDVGSESTAERIYNEKGEAATYTCTLSDPSGTPASGTCTLTVAVRKGSGATIPASGGADVVYDIDLSDDNFATRITLTGGLGGVNETLAGDVAATHAYTFNTSAVANWNSLRVRISVDAHGGSPSSRRSLNVTWIQLEAPGPSASNRTGTLNQAFGALTGTLTGRVPRTGVVSQALAAPAYTLSGWLKRLGTVNQAFPALTGTIEGDVPRTGTVNQALPALGYTIAGDIETNAVLRVFWARFDIPGSPDAYRLGYLNQELPALGYTAAGTVAVKGTTSQALGALGYTADGKVYVKGEVSQAFGVIPGTRRGLVITKGVTNYAFPAGTVSSTGNVWMEGDAEIAVPALTGTLTGAVKVQGVVDQAFGQLDRTIRANATGAIEGFVEYPLAAITGTATGTVQVKGVTNTALAAITGTADGWTARLGVVNYELAALTGTADGWTARLGVVNQALAALTGTLTGAAPRTGALSATLPALAYTITGTAVEQVIGTTSYAFPAVEWSIEGLSTAWRPVAATSETWTPVSNVAETWTPVVR